MEGRVNNNTAYGTYRVPGRLTAEGLGCFQLIASRAVEWLEGYCTWFDYDSTMVECSKNIWIRSNVHYMDEYKEDVAQMMTKEIDIAMRRKEYEI